MIGTTLSHYKIVAKLGQGGMGVVYKAEDTRLERMVALKVLPDNFSEELRERLLREARLAASLRHPNICPIYDVGEEDDKIFVSMAFLDGESLEEMLKVGGLPVELVTDMVRQTAYALHEAHTHGVIHRDVKCANILVTNKGEAMLLDFGLAKGNADTRLTTTGTMVGTASYMSPEQVQAQDVDHKTDIWSLGVVLYEALAGQLPFDAKETLSMMYAIANKEVAPLAEVAPWVPENLCVVVERALAKAPSERFETALQMAEALGGLRSGSGTTGAGSGASPGITPSESAMRSLSQPTTASQAERPTEIVKQHLAANESGYSEAAAPTKEAWSASNTIKLSAIAAILAVVVVMALLGNLSGPVEQAEPSTPSVAETEPTENAELVASTATQPESVPVQPQSSEISLAASPRERPSPVRLEPAEEAPPAVSAAARPPSVESSAGGSTSAGIESRVASLAQTSPAPVQATEPAPVVRPPAETPRAAVQPPAVPRPIETQEPTRPSQDAAANAAWALLADGQDAAGLRAFATQFADSPHAETARKRADEIEALARGRREIQQLLTQYEAAFSAMNLKSVAALRPSLSKDQRDRLAGSFRSAKSTSYSLVPSSEPRLTGGDMWSGDNALRAAITCRQRVQIEFRGGDRPPPVEQQVDVVVERIAGEWRILSID
jgi:serine/threonine protein kinase